MQGRRPKSIEGQIAKGDPGKHGKRKLQQRLDAVPKAASGLPACPRYLKGRARHIWNFWSTELTAMKLNKRPDGPMLEGACVAYARAVEADVLLSAEGILIKDTEILDGVVVVLRTKKHPAVEISDRCWMRVKSFASEFGLSPVSRTRLSVSKAADDNEDDLMKLLSAPREIRPGTSLVQ